MWPLRAAIATLIATSFAWTAWYAHNKGLQTGKAQVQAQWNAERLAITQAQTEAAIKARQKEQELQDRLAQQQKDYHNEVRRLATEHAALAHSLRQRAARPAESAGDLPQAPGAGVEPATGCTGFQLYRQDGEFLAREAARGDQLRLALRACIADRAEIERQLK